MRATRGSGNLDVHPMLASSGDGDHENMSGVINTRFDQRAAIPVMAVAFGACVLAFGIIALAAEHPLPDVTSAVAAAVADSSRPDSDTTRDAERSRSKRWPSAASNRGTRSPTISPIQAISRVSSPTSSAPRACLRGGAHRVLQVRAFRQGSRGASGLCSHPSQCNGHDGRGARRTQVPREARPFLDLPKLPRPAR